MKLFEGTSAVPEAAESFKQQSVIGNRNARAQPPTITRVDNVLREDQRKLIYDFLHASGWKFGWKSRTSTDVYSFWHKHFAGAIQPDHPTEDGGGAPYDCADELQRKAPLLHTFGAAWKKPHDCLKRQTPTATPAEPGGFP